jgi:hypothetical protein
MGCKRGTLYECFNAKVKGERIYCAMESVLDALKCEEVMSARAYILIDVVEGKAHEVVRILRRKLGITLVDCVEGPPDIVVMTEAQDNQTLADLTIRALTSIEHLTTDSQVLPVSSEELKRRRRGTREPKGS